MSREYMSDPSSPESGSSPSASTETSKPKVDFSAEAPNLTPTKASGFDATRTANLDRIKAVRASLNSNASLLQVQEQVSQVLNPNTPPTPHQPLPLLKGTLPQLIEQSNQAIAQYAEKIQASITPTDREQHKSALQTGVLRARDPNTGEYINWQVVADETQNRGVPALRLRNPDNGQEIIQGFGIEGFSNLNLHPGITTGAPDPEYGPTVKITAREGGRPVTVDWPIDDNRSLQKMRDILTDLEATFEDNGGLRVETRLKELEIAIKGLNRDVDPHNREIGLKMEREVKARLILHRSFINFAGSDDMGKNVSALSNLYSDAIDVYFQTAGFAEALSYYELHGKEYIDATNHIDDLNSFNANIRNNVLTHLSEKERQAAQNMAERFWQLSGGMAAKDYIYQDGPKYKFKGKMTLVRGNFPYRRLFRVEDTLKTQIQTQRAVPQMMKGVDFGTRTVLEDLVEDKILKNGETRAKVAAAIKPGRNLAELARDVEFPDGSKRRVYDFTVLDWNQVRMYNLFESQAPMGDYTYRYLTKPDSARDKLVQDQNSFIYNPNPESLRSTLGLFSYMDEKQYDNYYQMAGNLIDYWTHDVSTERGKIPWGRNRKIAEINKLASFTDENKRPFLFKDKWRQLLKEKLGIRSSLALEAEFITKGLAWGILGFLLGAIGFVRKRGFSSK